MSVNNSPSTSNVQSSQEICAFLNRFEKDIGSLSCCPDIEDLVTSELDSTEKRETAKSTSAHAGRFSKKFKEFLRQHDMSDDIEFMPESKLNFAPRYFYHEVRAENGDLLSPASLSCIRTSISRYLTWSHERQRCH